LQLHYVNDKYTQDQDDLKLKVMNEVILRGLKMSVVL